VLICPGCVAVFILSCTSPGARLCLPWLLQNLLGNDCAKARVNLCVTKDPACLPFQNIIDANGSTSAAAVGQVAPVLDQKCPVVEPSVPGVKVRERRWVTFSMLDLTTSCFSLD
jgi:hypothetical protein